MTSRTITAVNARVAARVGLLALAAIITGCAAPKFPRWVSVSDPKVTVTDVVLVEQTAGGARIEATLRLDNPNSVPLPLTRAKYTLTLAGRSESYETLPSRTVPARSSQTLVLAAAVPLEGSAVGAAYSLQGTINYAAPGEVRRALTESGLPLPSVSFSTQGTVMNHSND